MRTVRAGLSRAAAVVTGAVAVVTGAAAVTAGCGAVPTSHPSVTVRTVAIVYGGVEVSVPDTWKVSTACPFRQGTVYLGGVPDLQCAHLLLDNVVVLDRGSAASSPYGSPGVVNHIGVEWLDPGHTSMEVPSLGISIVATGPLARTVLATMTRSSHSCAMNGRSTGPTASSVPCEPMRR